MPRPKSKEELLLLGEENYEKLLRLIDSFSDEEKASSFPPGTMNRNIRDVLAHLHHWHLMMMTWYEVGMRGEKPEMPAPGYSWKTTPELNREIWKKYSDLPLKEARKNFEQSHADVMKLVRKHSNEELFERSAINGRAQPHWELI